MPEPSQARAPRTLVLLLALAVAVIGAVSLVLGPIAPTVAQDLGTTVPSVTAAMAAYGVGTASGAILLARYIDRIGVGRALTAAMTVLTLALAGSAAAPGAGWLAAAQALAGLSAGVGLPGIYAAATAVAPRGREAATLGTVLAGWTISLVAGVSLAALAADWAGWRSVYGGLAALAAVAAVALALSRLRRSAPGGGIAPSPLAALVVPGVRPLLLACCAYMVSFFGTYAFLGDYLVQSLGRPTSATALVTLSYGLGFGAAAPLVRLADRWGAARIQPAAFAFLAAVYVAMGLAFGSYAGLIAVAAAWGVANHVAYNLLLIRLASLDPARRGTILGLNSAATYISLCVGTLSFGQLYGVTAFQPLPYVSALVAAAGVGLTLMRIGPARR